MTSPQRPQPLRRRSLGALLACTLLTATASTSAWAQAIAPATVADTGTRLGGARGSVFFALQAVDGRRTAQDALRANEASRDELVLATTLTPVERTVPAGRHRLKLRGQKFDASPVASIRHLFSRGKVEAQDVEGEVELDLQPGQLYRVNGAIDNFRRQVWVEDAQGVVVSTTLNATLTPEQEATMAGAQYLCCNLRYDGDWVAEGAALDLPFVPAGSRVKLLDIETAHAVVLIEGRRLRLAKDEANPEPMSLALGRLLKAQPPAVTLAQWNAEDQRTLALGRVTVGMTRQQAEAALGRPPLALNPRWQVSDWRYALGTGEAIYLQFNAEGRVAGVDASRLGRSYTLREQVVLPPLSNAPTAPAAPAAPASTVPAAAAEPLNPGVQTHPIRPGGGASTPAAAGAPR